jgi:hypothetical protein
VRGHAVFTLDIGALSGQIRRVDHRRPELTKRQKELARQRRQQEKADRRQQRQRDREHRPAGEGEEDPDIAGIVPGPQPPSEE